MLLAEFSFSTRSCRVSALSVLPCLLVLLSAGCSTHPVSKSTSALSIGMPVPSSVQTQAKQVATQFVSEMKRQDYSSVQSSLSPTLKAQWPVSQLAKQMHGLYLPLTVSENLQFDLVQYIAHGKKLIVHGRFTDPSNNVYRTNFTLMLSGNRLLIDNILPPTEQRHPVGQEQKTKHL